MNEKRVSVNSETLTSLLEVIEKLLSEIGSGSDLGYHLDCDKFAGRLREALARLDIQE